MVTHLGCLGDYLRSGTHFETNLELFAMVSILTSKSRFSRFFQNAKIMHQSGLGDFLRSGKHLRTASKLSDMIWIDFMQIEKIDFFKILGPKMGTVVVWALTLPHGPCKKKL